MSPSDVLKGLERERQLLENFICLSEEQLLVLADEDLEGFDSFLEQRADLMIELTAIESTLATWIARIRNDSSVPSEMMKEMRFINDEIVRMANHVLEMDAQAQVRLEMIRQKTSAELQAIDKGQQAVRHYGSTYSSPKTNLKMKG